MRSYKEELHSARGTALQVSLLKLLPFDQNSLIFNPAILILSGENNLSSQSANI